MKHNKLNNVIFPIWFLLFFPPVIFITLAGNFIIDSLVLLLCFYIFKISNKGLTLKLFYKRSILKVWIFGFIADILGAALLFSIGIYGDFLNISYELKSAINYDPFNHPAAVVIIILAMILSGVLIFLFNYNITFKRNIEDRKLRIKIAVLIAIITIPWTFLLPTKLFYKGF